MREEASAEVSKTWSECYIAAACLHELLVAIHYIVEVREEWKHKATETSLVFRKVLRCGAHS